tara:strand:+ start:123 stop:776 length:654 start_codon:yes stop_codon:yes gene_type:complete
MAEDNPSTIAFQLTNSGGNLFLSVILAVLCVLASIFLCQILIEGSYRPKEQNRKSFSVNFIPLVKKNESINRPSKPIKKVEDPPTAGQIKPHGFISPKKLKLSQNTEPFSFKLPNVNIRGIVYGDGNYFPRIKIPPMYPLRARTQGIEGKCLVEFTITASGTVTDVTTVPGECRDIFKENSIKAAKNFIYRPRIVNGMAESVSNVKNRFIYKLEQND